MSSPALPLSNVCDIVVEISPQLPATPQFNVGCVIGNTAVIPASQRVRSYTSTAQMLTDGFLTSSPEYIAAQLYFDQTPAAETLIVGRQDATSIAAVTVPGGSTGTGFAVGNVVTVVQSGGSGGQLTVTSVGGSGQITGVSFTPGALGSPQGTGYAVANGLSLTGGAGTGATINITAVGDTALQALTYACAVNTTFWGVLVTTAVTADHEAIANFVQSPASSGAPRMYFYTTQDATALSGASGNVFSYMKANSYNRAFGLYSTTQGGAAPNNLYAAAGAMGVAMGLNTGLANSFFTMKFKTIVGVQAEPLTTSQVSTVEGNNGNLYLTYAPYTWLEQGTVGNGQFMDEVLNLDMLSAAIQFNIIDLLISLPSVPQTDAGETQLIHQVNLACQAAQQRGFIATGVWDGVTIINLDQGDSVPGGYLAQAYPFSQQSQSNSQARKMQPIYLAIIEAGAAHSIVVGVYVQR